MRDDPAGDLRPVLARYCVGDHPGARSQHAGTDPGGLRRFGVVANGGRSSVRHARENPVCPETLLPARPMGAFVGAAPQQGKRQVGIKCCAGARHLPRRRNGLKTGARVITHTGGCHCGRVRFEAIAPAKIQVSECNCSICSKAGYLHLVVPADRFKLVSGRGRGDERQAVQRARMGKAVPRRPGRLRLAQGKRRKADQRAVLLSPFYCRLPPSSLYAPMSHHPSRNITWP